MKSIITLLIEDHRKAKKNLELLVKDSEKAKASRAEIFDEVAADVTLHANFEEANVYPLLSDAGEEAHALTLEAIEEHRQAKELIEAIRATAVEDERWLAQVTVLKEDLEHHIEEEEDDLLPRLKKELDKERLEELGEQYQHEKEEQTQPTRARGR